MRKFAMAIVGAAVACSAARADITISNKPTENMTCSGGVCTATAKKAVLNASDLANMLASGDATVKSGIAKSIRVDQLLSWETTSRLTLDAKQSITVNKPITVAGNGALVRLVTSAGLISAKVVKVDAANDLALLKAEGRFAALPVAASRAVKLGGTVATVGFPNIGLQGFASG